MAQWRGEGPLAPGLASCTERIAAQRLHRPSPALIGVVVLFCRLAALRN